MSLRVLATGDLHLSYRAYERHSAGGINARERDLALTFSRLIDRAIALEPDIITIAGDVFHSCRPNANAVDFAFSQFARLRKALPATRVVMISGNHDANKTSDAGNFLPLFRHIGVNVIDRQPERLWFPEHGLSVLCVPDVIGVKRGDLIPDRNAKYNLLLLHGSVQGMPQNGAPPRLDVSKDELHAGAWDFASLGHYHVCQEIAPNCWYPGAPDYCTSDIWAELRAEKEAGLSGKGFILRDLETGAHEFHPLPLSRGHVDLPAIDLENPSPEDIDAAIRSAVDDAGGVKDKVVRLIVNVPSREVKRGLDHKQIRQYRKEAMAFNLDVRVAKKVEPPLSMMIRGVTSPGARGAPLGLHDRVRGKLTDWKLADDVDRSELIALGASYLDKAGEEEEGHSPLAADLVTSLNAPALRSA